MRRAPAHVAPADEVCSGATFFFGLDVAEPWNQRTASCGDPMDGLWDWSSIYMMWFGAGAGDVDFSGSLSCTPSLSIIASFLESLS